MCLKSWKIVSGRVVLQSSLGEWQGSMVEGSVCFFALAGAILYGRFRETGLCSRNNMGLETSQVIHFRHLLAVQKLLNFFEACSS